MVGRDLVELSRLAGRHLGRREGPRVPSVADQPSVSGHDDWALRWPVSSLGVSAWFAGRLLECSIASAIGVEPRGRGRSNLGILSITARKKFNRFVGFWEYPKALYLSKPMLRLPR